MNRRNLLQVFGGAGIICLSGCGSVPGINSASIDRMETTVEEGRAVLSFDYSIDDYATALFEGPDDRVISETRIEPDHSTSALPIGTLGGGEYELLIRQDGETVTSQTLTIDGADVLIANTNSEWSFNELTQVTVEIENVGDAPAYVEQAEFELEALDSDYNPSTVLNGYLEVGQSVAVNIEPAGGVEIEESGTTTGTVTVETEADPLTAEFVHELAPASLEFTTVGPNWDGSTLVDVTSEIQNTGDIPTTAQIVATADGNELDTTPTEEIDPGESQEFVSQRYETLYRATSGGEAEVKLTVESPAGSVSETVSRDIAGADVTVDSVSTGWSSGELVEVTADISNSGDIEIEAPLTVSVGDDIVRETPITVPGNTSETGVPLYDMTESYEEGYAVTSGGTYEVTVEIALDSGSVSASDSKDFDGLDTSFTNIQTTFFSAGYETDDVEFSGLDFNVRNGGDVVLAYDTIEVELAGASRLEGLYGPQRLLPGSSEKEYVNLSEDITVSPGQRDLTLSLLRDGEEVTSTTTTVSAE